MRDRYAVVGNPVAHSKSPEIHALFARQTAEAIEYTRLLAPLDGFEGTVRRFAGAGGRGLNVTVPFKFEAFRLATERTPRAETAGAVNTLRFDGNRILGDNTDGAGLVADITRNLGISLADARILMLGAGGAAYGVMLPLLEQKPLSCALPLDRAPASVTVSACWSNRRRNPFPSGGASVPKPRLSLPISDARQP